MSRSSGDGGGRIAAAGVVVGTAALAAWMARRAAARSAAARGESRQVPVEAAGAAVVPPPRHISWLGRRLDPYRAIAHQGLAQPDLPPAEVVTVPGRGEMFLRRTQVPDGADPTPVVLLHGWMASADLNWFRLFPALAERHAIVAPDLRGHGRGIRSPSSFTLEDCAEDVAGLLRTLGIDRAVVVGYSMGGPVALLLARRHPELVAGLVLEATGLEFQTGWLDRVTWRLTGLIGLLLRWPTGRIVLIRLTGGMEEVPEELLAYRGWAEGEFRRSDPMEMAETGRALGAFDARPFAGELGAPAVVVVTTRDRLVAPSRQLALARATGARVMTVDGDHSAAAMQADEFAAVTLAAIESLTGDRPPPDPTSERSGPTPRS